MQPLIVIVLIIFFLYLGHQSVCVLIEPMRK